MRILRSLPLAALLLATPTIAVSQLSNGWMEIRQTSGRVIITQSPPRPAKVGDRLNKPGDAIETAGSSTALLRLDSGMGSIQVAENTKLRIRKLKKLRDGSRITTLAIEKGQVRTKVRRFTSPRSSLQIMAPAGIAAVRGTEYGVSVSDDGRMVIATESGLVAASAQGATVKLEPGFGSRIREGQRPSPPQKFDKLLKLTVENVEINNSQVHVNGSVHPLNSLVVAGAEVSVGDDGSFEASIEIPTDFTSLAQLYISVSNPLGEEKSYPLLAGLR